MSKANRGEAWLVDQGYLAKTRPALVISIPPLDMDRALVAVVPHTTSQRGTRFEVVSGLRFLKPGAFDAQNINTVSEAKLIRHLGTVPPDLFNQVVEAVELWFGIRP